MTRFSLIAATLCISNITLAQPRLSSRPQLTADVAEIECSNTVEITLYSDNRVPCAVIYEQTAEGEALIPILDDVCVEGARELFLVDSNDGLTRLIADMGRMSLIVGEYTACADDDATQMLNCDDPLIDCSEEEEQEYLLVNCDDPLIDCSEEEEVDVPWGLDPSKEEDQKDYLDTQVPIDDCEFWRTDCPNLEEL